MLGLSQRWVTLVTVIVLSVLASACVGSDAAEVTVERVSAGPVTQSVSAPARVEPAAQLDVAAAVSGIVADLRGASGDRVEAGDAVVRLESAQVALVQEQASAAQAAADAGGGIDVDAGGAATRAAAAAAVRRLDADVGPQLATARTRADTIHDPDQRAAALSAIDAVEASYRATRSALLSTGETAAAQQEAIANSVASALNQVIDQASAGQRVQAEAVAAAATAQQEQLTVAAPFAGTIQLGEAAASDGAVLPPGLPASLAGAAAGLTGLAGASGGGTLRVGAPVVAGQTLFTVYDLSSLYVRADIDEVDAPQVMAGQRAVVVIDAFPDAQFEGVVEAIQVEAATTEAGGVGYPVRIRLLGPADGSEVSVDGLRVGMTASAEIATKTVDSKLVVPSRALLRREGGTIVYVIRDDDTVAVVEVDVLALGEDDAAVSGDLSDDDQVVVSGYESLVDGDPVTIR